MSYERVQRLLPRALQRYLLHFEAAIDDELAAFARQLPKNAIVLDAGAGECSHAKYFQNSRYVAVDLGVGDKTWDYHKLDAIADLLALPFPEFTFDGCINIVTLEHVREPGCALREIARVLKTGGVFLTVVPHEWEVHQSPHDYFRYTRHGLEYLLQKADFTDIRIQPVGGYFRLLARRLLNGLQFFPGLLFPFAALLLVPPALLLPLLDSLDRNRNFTLGYVCSARKPS